MRVGGDKEIIKALEPFEKTQVRIAACLGLEDQRSFREPTVLAWIDPAYPHMLHNLAKVMRQLGYKRGRWAEIAADTYMNGYVRGLYRGAKAAGKLARRRMRKRI
jgi:hypothetical protein